mmetsp:Transcript_3793/g.6474  ORF Transcript_3793/g.6474 Transcript_3793/m.6474 type:complete len:81 (+) Transcript_3793:136-378(+)
MHDLTERFGYTIKTYNLLGMVLMTQGEYEKACQIFDTALTENNIYEMAEGELDPSNQQLACLIFNYIKCNAIRNGSTFMS